MRVLMARVQGRSLAACSTDPGQVGNRAWSADVLCMLSQCVPEYANEARHECRAGMVFSEA